MLEGVHCFGPYRPLPRARASEPLAQGAGTITLLLDAMEIDPYANDPGHWGASLASLAEIMIPCLDAAAPRSVVEVGAYAGDLTRLLLEWAAGSGTQVQAIDPSPEEALERLSEQRPELELICATSLEALSRIAPPEAVIIDGDHNYYTVSQELRVIDERAPAGTLPLLLLHDVGWPHGRRDSYFAPEQIPAEHRQPIVEGPGLLPGVAETYPGGLPYHYAAQREGGPRNGVLTAVEDFVAERDDLRLAIVPAFFGLGVLWHLDAPWGEAVAELLEPWDRNPLLERLEANRVLHLASLHVQLDRASTFKRRNDRQEPLLRRMLDSRAFYLAERLSRLRRRGEPVFSREDVERALAD